jgi:hypothetical protein
MTKNWSFTVQASLLSRFITEFVTSVTYAGVTLSAQFHDRDWKYGRSNRPALDPRP